MNRYRVCGRTLQSNIPIPELPPAADAGPGWTFTLHPPRVAFSRTDWFHHWQLPDGQVWLQISRTGTEYLLRFPDLADFEVSADRIACYPHPAAPLDSLKHLLLDQVLPLILSKQGKLVLHASAVSGPGGAIAFTGRSGQGKSTLAASFSTHGYQLLTDDCLTIEGRRGGIYGTALYPSLRLYPDSVDALFENWTVSAPVAHYSSKQRLSLEQAGLTYDTQPVRLERIYILDESVNGAGVSIQPLTAREVFFEIVKLAFLLDVDDPHTLRTEFENVAQAAALPVFRRLSYAREYSMLPAIRQEILRDMLTNSSSSTL